MKSKVYKFLNLETPAPHTIVESTNTEFFKVIFPFKNNLKIIGVNEPILRKSDRSIVDVQSTPRKRKHKNFNLNFVVCMAERDPLSYQKAMK